MRVEGRIELIPHPEQYPEEGHRGSRGMIQGDGPDPGPRHLADQQDASDASLGGHRQVGDDSEVGDALVCDGGDQTDIHRSGRYLVGAQRGRREFQLEPVFRPVLDKAPGQRQRIDVADDGELEFSHPHILAAFRKLGKRPSWIGNAGWFTCPARNAGRRRKARAETAPVISGGTP